MLGPEGAEADLSRIPDHKLIQRPMYHPECIITKESDRYTGPYDMV